MENNSFIRNKSNIINDKDKIFQKKINNFVEQKIFVLYLQNKSGFYSKNLKNL